MFGWLRKRSNPSPPSDPPRSVGLPPFRPEGAALLSTVGEVEATLAQERAVVYLTVEWSAQERHSRLAFVEFLRRIEQEYPGLRVTFWVLSEYSEGAAEWFAKLKLPPSVGTGYGAVVWLERGQVLALAPYAAEVGIKGLVGQTVEFWGGAAQAAPADRPRD